MSQENVEIVRRIFDAADRRDEKAFVQLWHPDAEWRPRVTAAAALEGAVYRGHDDLRQYLRDIDQTLDELHLDPVTVEPVTPEHVLTVVRLTGVGAHSRVPVEATSYVVHQVREGVCVRATVHATKAEALEAAGVGAA